MQDDIGGDLEFVAAVIAGSVHKKQDQFLVIFLRQGLEKNLEAFGTREIVGRATAPTAKRSNFRRASFIAPFIYVVQKFEGQSLVKGLRPTRTAASFWFCSLRRSLRPRRLFPRLSYSLAS